MSSTDGALRILLTVHHDLVAGTGAPGSTLSLAEELERRGHRVEVLGLDLLGHRRGATIDAVRFPHAVRRIVGQLLERNELDVLDASSGDLAYLDASIVRASRAAVLTRSHGLEPLVAARRREAARAGELKLRWRYSIYHGGLRLREVARSLRAADGALVLNDAEASYVSSVIGLPPSRVWRTAEIAAPLPPVDAPPDGVVRDVLVLGPASWRKGGDVSTRVLESLLRADVNVTASWHGLDDPEATVARFGADLRDRVQAVGRYDGTALSALLASHRVLLFASRAEGLPVTLLEALGAGIAVVGADVPGVHDLLEGGAGILVPDGHVTGFVGSLRSLLADPTARAACVARGVEVAATYATGAVVDRVETTYHDVRSSKKLVA